MGSGSESGSFVEILLNFGGGWGGWDGYSRRRSVGAARWRVAGGGRETVVTAGRAVDRKNGRDVGVGSWDKHLIASRDYPFVTSGGRCGLSLTFN